MSHVAEIASLTGVESVLALCIRSETEAITRPDWLLDWLLADDRLLELDSEDDELRDELEETILDELDWLLNGRGKTLNPA